MWHFMHFFHKVLYKQLQMLAIMNGIQFLLLALVCEFQGDENGFTNNHFNEDRKVTFKET